MSKKDFEGDNKEMMKKMDSLVEQNKTIAKGLSMMYENEAEQPKPVQRTYQQPKTQNFSSDRLLELKKIAAQVNPLLTRNRIWAGIHMLILNPSRVLKYSLNYLKNFFP